MRIVHFSTTKCAGGPYRLVSLLNKHSNLEVNLIDLKRWDIYPHDIIYEEEKEKAYELANNADIIHFHNYYDQNSRFFTGLDFKKLKRKGVKFLCQYRSEPQTISLNTKATVSEIINYDIPTIVIAQYPERFYPNSQVVPNAVPSNETLYMPGENNIEYDILFSPTKSAGAWEKRWDTKGSSETLDIMNKLKKSNNCRVKLLKGKPVSEVLREKQKARIVLDDMVTGSYHMSGIEAICQAKAVLCYIDHRILHVLQEISGAFQVPFVNVRLEEAYHVLKHLVENHDLTKEIGCEGRKWIDQYWSEEIIVNHYVEIYNKLIDNPFLVKRQESLRVERDHEKYFSLTLPDIIYNCRSERFLASLSFRDKFIYLKRLHRKKMIKFRNRLGEKLKDLSLNYLPIPVIAFLKRIYSFLLRENN